jgi:2'-5' RNA ligase
LEENLKLLTMVKAATHRMEARTGMAPETMAVHWQWRRGWRPGRRKYAWHFTFEDQPPVQDLAARYQERLAALPGLDPVPAQWLHLTAQAVGFTDEVGDTDVAAIIDAARRRLEPLSPAQVTIGPALATPEAILLDVAPVSGLAAVRAGLRAAIGDVWPADQVPGTEDWMPHVSVAYSHTTAPSEPYAAALAGCSESACTLIKSVRLIVLGRDRQVYEWATRASIQLSLRTSRSGSLLDVPKGALAATKR